MNVMAYTCVWGSDTAIRTLISSVGLKPDLLAARENIRCGSAGGKPASELGQVGQLLVCGVHSLLGKTHVAGERSIKGFQSYMIWH